MGFEMRILVVEDERTLAGFIEQSLRAEGHAATVAHDGERGELEALTGDYALVLLDLMLPGKGGLDVLDAIRAPELPVIVLTAQGAVEQGRGSRPRGQRLRDKAVLAGGTAGAGARAAARPRAAGGLGARSGRHTARPAHPPGGACGTEVHLTAREFELLAYLARHPDQVLSREQILNAVWASTSIRDQGARGLHRLPAPQAR